MSTLDKGQSKGMVQLFSPKQNSLVCVLSKYYKEVLSVFSLKFHQQLFDWQTPKECSLSLFSLTKAIIPLWKKMHMCISMHRKRHFNQKSLFEQNNRHRNTMEEVLSMLYIVLLVDKLLWLRWDVQKTITIVTHWWNNPTVSNTHPFINKSRVTGIWLSILKSNV